MRISDLSIGGRIHGWRNRSTSWPPGSKHLATCLMTKVLTDTRDLSGENQVASGRFVNLLEATLVPGHVGQVADVERPNVSVRALAQAG
jgi:hypothetical protein